MFRSAISHNACSVACTLVPSRNACCILCLSASHSAMELARTSDESSRLLNSVGFGSSPGLAAVVTLSKARFLRVHHCEFGSRHPQSTKRSCHPRFCRFSQLLGSPRLPNRRAGPGGPSRSLPLAINLKCIPVHGKPLYAL